MATLEDLVSGKALYKFEAKFDPGELEQRLVYLCMEALEWCYSSRELGYKCPNPDSYDKVHAVLTEFVAGGVFQSGRDIRRLAQKDDVWEIKVLPPDAARIFGWFYKPNVFVATHCVSKKDVPRFKYYAPHIKKVCDLRKSMEIHYDEKFEWLHDEKQYTNL